MMYWLLATIFSCLFFSTASLGDKLVLSGPSKSRVYTFFVAVASGLVIVLIPFVGFSLDASHLLWAALESTIYIAGLYAAYSAVEKFDISKVMAIIGATQPIFILFLTWIFWGFETLSLRQILAFIVLLSGTVIISMGKSASATKGFLKLTILASLLFSLDYIFQKFVFLNQPFLQGFVQMRTLSFLFVLVFLLSKTARKEIFGGQTNVLSKKTRVKFFSTQVSGGLANFLQSFAIFLAPVGFLPIINSLKGLQYVFLFIITLFFSFFFPKILKEEITKKAIFQKSLSIMLIVLGLAILVY